MAWYYPNFTDAQHFWTEIKDLFKVVQYLIGTKTQIFWFLILYSFCQSRRSCWLAARYVLSFWYCPENTHEVQHVPNFLIWHLHSVNRHLPCPKQNSWFYTSSQFLCSHFTFPSVIQPPHLGTILGFFPFTLTSSTKYARPYTTLPPLC